MTGLSQVLLSGLVATVAVNAQAYDSGVRDENAFSYIQPRNTTILGPYGHSPAVLPSRMYSHQVYAGTPLTNTPKQMPPAQTGRQLSPKPSSSSLN